MGRKTLTQITISFLYRNINNTHVGLSLEIKLDVAHVWEILDNFQSPGQTSSLKKNSLV